MRVRKFHPDVRAGGPGRVHTTGDATGALRLPRDADVDAMFLDIRMPGLDGMGLARGAAPVRPAAGHRADYARLHTADGSHLVRVPLARLAQRWAAAGFVRIHRSYLVQLGRITELRLAGPSSGYVVVVGGTVLPVSRRHTSELRDRLVRAAKRDWTLSAPGRRGPPVADWQKRHRAWVQANDACRRHILVRLGSEGPLPSRTSAAPPAAGACQPPWPSAAIRPSR